MYQYHMLLDFFKDKSKSRIVVKELCEIESSRYHSVTRDKTIWSSKKVHESFLLSLF